MDCVWNICIGHSNHTDNFKLHIKWINMGSRVTTMIRQIYLFAAKQKERMEPWLIGHQFGWSSNRTKFRYDFPTKCRRGN